jgi:hypothetical protein
MSVWSTTIAGVPPLSGAEGTLVSVSISVAPSRLEGLLDALAHLDFPINPQICHGPGPETVVEFPAYERRLEEIRGMLETCGFPARSVIATRMLEYLRRGAA